MKDCGLNFEILIQTFDEPLILPDDWKKKSDKELNPMQQINLFNIIKSMSENVMVTITLKWIMFGSLEVPKACLRPPAPRASTRTRALNQFAYELLP